MHWRKGTECPCDWTREKDFAVDRIGQGSVELADGAWLVVGKREKDEAWRGEGDVLQLGKYVHWHTSSCTDSGEQNRQFGKGGRHRLAMVGRDGW